MEDFTHKKILRNISALAIAAATIFAIEHFLINTGNPGQDILGNIYALEFFIMGLICAGYIRLEIFGSMGQILDRDESSEEEKQKKSAREKPTQEYAFVVGVLVVAAIFSMAAILQAYKEVKAADKKEAAHEIAPVRIGPELYSWRDSSDKKWRFVLLLSDIPRAGHPEEALTTRGVVDSVEKLEVLFAQLPVSEQVIWRLPEGDRFAMPPDRVRRQIAACAEKHGIRLAIEQRQSSL